jgi:uncharacterized protein
MENRGIMNRIFPVKYDFYQMLEAQAIADSDAIGALISWLDGAAQADEASLNEAVKKADNGRKELERKLVEAFSTPFDRGDIYYISITMAKSLDYANSTLIAMKAFEVEPDDIIRSMASKLKLGAVTFTSAVGMLQNTPKKAELLIPSIRMAHMDIEQLYRNGMCAVFSSGDAMNALRHREVYHHLKDSSKYLDDAVDILHRIIVRLT